MNPILLAIIIVCIIWFFHSIYNLGKKTILDLKKYYLETGHPIKQKNFHKTNFGLRITFSNATEGYIISTKFRLTIKSNEKIETLIVSNDFITNPLRPYSTKINMLFETEQDFEIINCIPHEVIFENGNVWKNY